MLMGRLYAMHVVFSKYFFLQKTDFELQGANLLMFTQSLKLHHEKRPLSMKTDNIKKRQRTDNSSNNENRLKERKKTANKSIETKETTYQFMEGIIHLNNKNETNSEYSPFSSFGVNQFNCTA